MNACVGGLISGAQCKEGTIPVEHNHNEISLLSCSCACSYNGVHSHSPR